MERWFTRQLEQWREYRKRKLAGVAGILLNSGLTSVRMTLLSLLLGMGAAYFLFQSSLLYIVLALLHLLADALDGVIASLEVKPAPGGVRWGVTWGVNWGADFGKYFDAGTDAFVTLLLLGKVAFTLQDPYAFIVVGLYALVQLIYFISRMAAPTLQVRTVTVVLLMISALAFPWLNQLLLLVIGISGVSSLYSLARQLQWRMGRR
ncbi:MAG: hypothetical protein AABX13_03295 [Nanoarchaeota archaeon]